MKSPASVRSKGSAPAHAERRSGVSVSAVRDGLGLRIDVAADQRGDGSVSRVQLRWRHDLAPGVLVPRSAESRTPRALAAPG